MGFNPEEQYFAREVETMFNRWHSADEVWDKELDLLIHRMYAAKLEEQLEEGTDIDWSVPFFSPSSANADKRELYMKVKKAKKDKQARTAVQGRWTRMGTASGDVLQRDLLFIEKHWEKKFGTQPPFVPARTDQGYPFWEEFAQKFHKVKHRGHEFAFNGMPDGVLVHTETGERVGIEFKTKSTTAAQTSAYSMREPKEDHFRQCVAYAIMYNLDRYVIVYNNLSKKSWMLDGEEYRKHPDFRCFEVEITRQDKVDVLNYLADVMDAAAADKPPEMDLNKFTFNNYKRACAESLTDAEYEQIKQQTRAVLRSSVPQWKKDSFMEAFTYIKEIRKGGAA